jgi:hypothetical protein
MSGTKLDRAQPFVVPAHIRKVHLLVVGENDPLPPAAMALTHRSPVKKGLRLAGGCKGLTADDKELMEIFFSVGLRRFRGFISSGGTRDVKNGLLDPMVTDIPALLAAQSPDQVITLSTVPRVGDFQLVDNSRLTMEIVKKDYSYESHPNPGVHMLVYVQSHDGSPLDSENSGWDGDLNTYFNLFGNLVRTGGWDFGMIVYNGGNITRKEAFMAIKMGWPVIIVQGSGREADAMIAEIEVTGDISYGDKKTTVDRSKVWFVRNNDLHGLDQAVELAGLIA